MFVDLALEPRGKILINDISVRALKWVASDEGLRHLAMINADYVSFAIAVIETERSGGWGDYEFDKLWWKWSWGRHSTVQDSSFQLCCNIKCISIQNSDWYIYLKGYEQRPFPNQTYMIQFPSNWSDYIVRSKLEREWMEWRSKSYSISYPISNYYEQIVIQ